MITIDATTTPRSLRPFQLLFLLLLGVAWVDASVHAMSRPTFRQYLMGWKMFTEKSTRGTDHRAEVQFERNGPFRRVELHDHFPSRWGSGYRYSRFRDRRRLTMVAAALCHRLETPAHAVRIYQVRWHLKAGTTERVEPTEQLIARHRCNQPLVGGAGRVIPLHPQQEQVER